MHFHTPFHPFQHHPVSAPTVELWNLLLILLGVMLVLLFKPFTF
jgi:hypothetical protein